MDKAIDVEMGMRSFVHEMQFKHAAEVEEEMHRKLERFRKMWQYLVICLVVAFFFFVMK